MRHAPSLADIVIVILASGLLTTGAWAQNSAKTVAQGAKEALKDMNDPERCRLGIKLSEADLSVLTHVSDKASPIRAGDRLLKIGGTPIRGYPEIGPALTAVPKGGQVLVEFERDGVVRSETASCINPAATRAQFAMVESAANKDWAKCVTAFKTYRQIYEPDASLLSLYAECAGHAKGGSRAQYVIDTYQQLKVATREYSFVEADLRTVRTFLLSNRTFFEKNGQLALYEDLDADIRAAAVALAERGSGPSLATPVAASERGDRCEPRLQRILRGGKSMLLLVASGTAVRVEKLADDRAAPPPAHPSPL